MVMENIQEIKNLVQEIKLKRQNRLWNNIFRAYNPCSEIWLDEWNFQNISNKIEITKSIN